VWYLFLTYLRTPYYGDAAPDVYPAGKLIEEFCGAAITR
jgi:hypothetical protein